MKNIIKSTLVFGFVLVVCILSQPKSVGAVAAELTSTDTVALTSVEAAGRNVAADKTFNIDQNDTINLIGKTVANGEVTITIHSDPKTSKVSADANGKWAFSVAWLEPGSHYIEAFVTNPTTKKVSATTKLVTFNVTSPNGSTKTSSSSKSSNTKIYIGLGVAVVVLIGGIIYWRRQRSTFDGATTEILPAANNPPQNTPSQTTSPQTTPPQNSPPQNQPPQV